ncbi:hypothetical protein F2P56_032719 [Juglans regia]|uniref:NAC domain-containing protein 2-like n=2 Tax=Juglans regia TaxID=51240 RepID=A0A2I4EJ74_JUGRE|nr:NAC domain-containing protein 2-like [Juglans regia]KAF5447149.1 hypothetical protein F2P56_032719 [Juglans regia]
MGEKPFSDFQLPPGFRFHPSDEELIVHYLQNKVNSCPIPAFVIAEVDLYKYNPWELPCKALLGEDEWYFFTPRDRKYPNGERPNRVAASGYWKATGSDKPILTSCGSRRIGVKKALAFYTGPSKRVKTDWIMTEYRLPHLSKPSRSKGSMRLDDWVLCRVRHKGNMSKDAGEDQDSCSLELQECLPKIEQVQPTPTKYDADMITDYLNKDCGVLAWILPTIQTISSVSSEGHSKSNDFIPVHGSGTNKVNSTTTVSSMDSYINHRKRKSSEENEYEYFRSNEKLKGKNEKKNPQPGKTLANYDINFYSQNQYQYGIFNPEPSESIITFQGHIESPFMGK